MKHKNVTSVARKFIATIEVGHNADRNVAIIGGGIGGLTAALAFAHHDANVTVYEQAHALTEVGAGLQITPNAARVLSRFGLDVALAATGVRADAVMPMDALTGEMIARFDLQSQTPPYRFCHRAALIDLLWPACDAMGVKVKLGARIDVLRPDGSFDGPDGRVTPDLTIGADGLRSVVRGVINEPSEPAFTGQVAWRAVVKHTDAAPVAQIWMAPGRHIVTYPLSERRMNIVAVQERREWAEEGWHHADDPGNLQTAFDDVCAEVKGLLAMVEDVNLWGLFRHPVALKWHTQSLAILGDAAHPTLPFLAQGANLAIEDAYVLARCCNEAVSIDDGLQAYQTTRRPRVVRAIKAANANAVNYHLTGVKRRVAHAGLRMMGRHAPQMFLNRLAWLYDHDVTA